MKKLFMICFMGLALTASAGIFPDNNYGGEGGSTGDVSNDTHVDINQNIDVVINNPTVQGEQGIQGESIVGPQGLAGVVDYTGVLFLHKIERDRRNNMDKLIQSSSNALNGIEFLDKEHSIGSGYSNVSGKDTLAIGYMWKPKASVDEISWGLNVKGYHALSDKHKGLLGGISLGW